VAASQYSFIVPTTDHGTWRRLRHFTATRKFRKNPDPHNDLERKEDQRFVREFPNDPEFLSSVLEVLSHYLERLIVEHKGELKNVRCPTIERQTEAFRISQDSLHRWICESIVVSPDAEVEYPLGVLGGYYTEWYAIHIERKRHVASDVIKAMEASVLSKYLKAAPNRTQVLKGCRVLTADDLRDLRGVILREGEQFISEAELRGASQSDWGPDGSGVGARAGLNWWEARPAPELRSDGASADARADAREDAKSEDLFSIADEDAQILQAELRAERPANVKETPELADAEIDALLDGGFIAQSRDAYSLDDVYG
jgi:hypothetical protein